MSNSAKLQMLLPIMEKLASEITDGEEELTALIVACFDQTAAGALNDRSSQAWDVYLKVVRKYFQSGVAAGPRIVLARKLEKALFSKLRLDRKVETCKVLLEQSQEHADIVSRLPSLFNETFTHVSVVWRMQSVVGQLGF